uniref:F-box domain-containing protein n=2 Tax=Moniliophthora roreri TaxID=221103 RepID=A0A0W0EV28_MONRR
MEYGDQDPHQSMPLDNAPAVITTNTNVPNEILTAIFLQLPPSTLSELARVSHRFNAVAELILYSSISIKDILSESSPHPWRTFQCCESILRRRNLLENIRRLHIRWQKDPRSPPSHLHFASTSAKLAQVLTIATTLESLELFMGPANIEAHPGELHIVERMIRGCRFPRLQQCFLGAEAQKGSPPYSGILDAFLASLPFLRHLKLLDHHAALNIPSDALRHLASFRGSPDTAAFLLPGRPVEYLSLVGQDSDVNRDNLPRFTQTSIPLRVLDLSAMTVRPILLRNIANYIPTVEVLRIRLALRHTLHYALSGIRILTGLASVLSAFQHLTYLDLSPTTVVGGMQSNNDQELSLCREWTRACPSLRKVIFPSHKEWIRSPDDAWSSRG